MAETEEVTTVTQTSEPAQVVKTTRKISPPAIKLEHPQDRYETKKVIFRTYQIIWYILGVFETLLVLRVFLKALGANPASGFVNFIYMLSAPLAIPFSGMFRHITEGSSVFEVSTFVGMFVYLLIAYGLVELFQFLKPTTPDEVEENV